MFFRIIFLENCAILTQSQTPNTTIIIRGLKIINFNLQYPSNTVLFFFTFFFYSCSPSKSGNHFTNWFSYLRSMWCEKNLHKKLFHCLVTLILPHTLIPTDSLKNETYRLTFTFWPRFSGMKNNIPEIACTFNYSSSIPLLSSFW